MAEERIVSTEETDEEPNYLSYLMRLWRERSEGRSSWRASLQSVLSGEIYAFAALDDLCDFLKRQTSHVPPADKIATKEDAHHQQS